MFFYTLYLYFSLETAISDGYNRIDSKDTVKSMYYMYLRISLAGYNTYLICISIRAACTKFCENLQRFTKNTTLV